jgi:hypothetical protein
MRPDEGTSTQPRFPEPEIPDGHGDPHAPAGGFSVQAQDLVSASLMWDEISSALVNARNLMVSGGGYPGIFGRADTFYTAGRLHMNFNNSITRAAHDGSILTTYIANGLVEVANEFSGTDASQAQTFQNLE